MTLSQKYLPNNIGHNFIHRSVKIEIIIRINYFRLFKNNVNQFTMIKIYLLCLIIV